MWAEIAGYSFYPDRDTPEYGALHVHTDAFRGDLGGRATLRGEADPVLSLEQAHRDLGQATEGLGSIAGNWQMAPGWPEDWGYDGFADEDIWSEPFTFDAEGRPVVLE